MGAADKHPRRDFTQITQAGLKTHELGTVHRAVIEPRLEAGVLPGLAADLTSLGALVPAAKAKKAQTRASTASQDAALADGWARVSAIRENISRRKASAELRKAYGVGAKANPGLVKDVQAAITIIVDRATAHPEEARSLGILPADVTALEASRTAIASADAAQEQSRGRAPLSTKARNQAANRVLAAINAVAGAGAMEFATNPEVRASFEALASLGARKAKPKKKTE